MSNYYTLTLTTPFNGRPAMTKWTSNEASGLQNFADVSRVYADTIKIGPLPVFLWREHKAGAEAILAIPRNLKKLVIAIDDYSWPEAGFRSDFCPHIDLSSLRTDSLRELTLDRIHPRGLWTKSLTGLTRLTLRHPLSAPPLFPQYQDLLTFMQGLNSIEILDLSGVFENIDCTGQTFKKRKIEVLPSSLKHVKIECLDQQSVAAAGFFKEMFSVDMLNHLKPQDLREAQTVTVQLGFQPQPRGRLSSSRPTRLASVGISNVMFTKQFMDDLGIDLLSHNIFGVPLSRVSVQVRPQKGQAEEEGFWREAENIYKRVVVGGNVSVGPMPQHGAGVVVARSSRAAS